MASNWSDWTSQIAKNLVKQVDISVGENHTTIYNLGEGKTARYYYYKDGGVDVEYKDENNENDMKNLFEKSTNVNNPNKSYNQE